MSSSLSVKLKNDIKIYDLLFNCELVLKKLLRHSDIPQLMVYSIENNVRIPFQRETFGEDKDFILVGFEGYEDSVCISTAEIPIHLPHVTEDEAGKWAVISVGIKRSSIEFVLAASLAIALAKMQDSCVIDDGCRWNKVSKQKPEEFMQAISVGRNYDEALKEIIHNLKLSK